MSIIVIHLFFPFPDDTAMKDIQIRGCTLLPDGRMVLSCYNASIVRFMSKEGVELFHFDEDKTGCRTYDTVYSHCVVPCRSQHVTVFAR
jgi:hypothetical protein